MFVCRSVVQIPALDMRADRGRDKEKERGDWVLLVAMYAEVWLFVLAVVLTLVALLGLSIGERRWNENTFTDILYILCNDCHVTGYPTHYTSLLETA